MKHLGRTFSVWFVLGLTGVVSYGLGLLVSKFVLQIVSGVLSIVIGSGILALLVGLLSCGTCGDKKQRDESCTSAEDG